jgi:curved DNA-binding protein CbpA
MAKSYYEILQVPPDASSEIIRAAYKSLSAKYHPDEDPSNEAAGEFAKVQEAFETLSDANRKAAYDFEFGPAPVVTLESSEFAKGGSQTKVSWWGLIFFAASVVVLVLFVINEHFGFTPYRNKDSGVSEFEYGADWIRVKFRDGEFYEYRASKIGQSHINEMKRLADAGEGLTTYVNTHRDVYYGWSFQFARDGKVRKAANITVDESPLKSTTPSSTRAELAGRRSSTTPQIPLTGRWVTSNGDSLQLTEYGNTVKMELLRSSAMSSGTGTLTRTGDSLNGTLTGTFDSAPSTKLTSTFVGTVTSGGDIEYTVDAVRFIGKSPRVIGKQESFTMRRVSN